MATLTLEDVIPAPHFRERHARRIAASPEVIWAALPQLDAMALRAFATAGWVKVGLDFVLEPDGGGTTLRTETRVTATDARTRARFGSYWLFIRVGSGIIRRDLLRTVARMTEGRPGS